MIYLIKKLQFILLCKLITCLHITTVAQILTSGISGVDNLTLSIYNAFVSQVNRVDNFSCNINFIGVFIIENYNLSRSHTTECYTGLHIFRAATAGLRTTTLKIRK